MNFQTSEINSNEEINTETLIEDTSELISHGLTPEKDFTFWKDTGIPTRNIWKIIGYKNTLNEGKIYYAKNSLWKEEEFGTLEEIIQFFKEKIFEFVN